MKKYILFEILLLMAAFVFCGCGGAQTKVKITQGEHVWYSCDVWVGGGYVSFKDEKTGKRMVVEGTTLVEETDIPCAEE